MSTTNTRSPFRSKGFIVAAIVVGAIILAAIIALATSLLGGGDTNADPTPVPTTSATADAEETDPSICGLEGYEETSSLETAPDNDWELIGTMAAPVDERTGPGDVDVAGFRSCFAHTAEGALFAAVNFVATGTDAAIGPRLIELVAPGPGRDVLEGQGSDGNTSNLRAQVAGYKVSAYSADAATVDLALNYSSGQLVSLPFKLVWAEGDWKVEVTDAGEFPLAPAQLQNLGGYTPWSGA